MSDPTPPKAVGIITTTYDGQGAYVAKFYHDDCDGEWVSNGDMWKDQHIHKCRACGKTARHPITYPRGGTVECLSP